jgi:CxxC motif-containing protein (DUF1111 family)
MVIVLADRPAKGVFSMKRTYRVWYLLVLFLALVPAAARLYVWQRGARPQVIDPAMARAGELLFNHNWAVNDSLCPEGDGLGPLYNATSCVACHHQGGVGGGGGLEHNVTTFTVRIEGQQPRQGVLHAHHVLGLNYRENLQDIHPSLPRDHDRLKLNQIVRLPGQENHCLRFPQGVHLSQRNTPALFGARLIDEIPARVIIAGARKQRVKWGGVSADDEAVPVGRALRLANGKIGRFGWKAQMASLSDFVRSACANELGLGNPSEAQPVSLRGNAVKPRVGLDLTDRQCDQITAFCASLPKPVEQVPRGATAKQVAAGKKLFTTVGCAECHTAKLGNVDGIYSDLLLHNMGEQLVGGGSYGEQPIPGPDSSEEAPSPSEWRTPPLWGVADSAPYLHDGRAATLEEAIKMHSGQGARAARAFTGLNHWEQVELIAFLKSLRAPGAGAERVASKRGSGRLLASLKPR